MPWFAVGGTRVHTLSRFHLPSCYCAAAACRAVDRAAVVRVVSKALQVWAPQAKRALAACFFHLPVDPRPAPHEDGDAAHLTIQVEAVGSGIVVLPALQVHWDTTVAALKARIQGCRGGIRLFAGHGGKELADDLQSVRAAGVAHGATLVLMSVSDQETLSRLFEATRGGQWRRRNGWGPSSTAPLSTWEGVGLDGVGGVSALHLTANGLQGAYMALRASVWAAPRSKAGRTLSCLANRALART